MAVTSRRRTGAASHRRFLAWLALGFLVILGLLEYTFLRFPTSKVSSGTGPKANVPIWFGAEGAGTFYLGLGVFYACLYLWVGAQSGRSGRAWRPGALCGLVVGGTWLLVSLVAAWLPALGAVRAIGLLALFGLPMVAGVLGARTTGRVGDGVLAGFWCGVVAAVLIAGAIIAVDNAFATALVHTSWANDPTCPQPAGPALAGCEIGDDLGFVAIALAVIPLLLAAIGTAGGAIGAASVPPQPAMRQADHAGPREPSRWRAPLIFSGLMLALFIAEIVFKLV
jgi:hypothetical protein